MKDEAYLIKDIAEFGKFCAFCIDNDIRLWRVYWDEREAGKRAYHIIWRENHCEYCDIKWYQNHGIEIVEPKFYLDQYGCYKIQIE